MRYFESSARWLGLFGIFVSLFVAALMANPTPAAAATGPAAVSYETGVCGETVFSASATGSTVSNQWLVVSANGVTEAENIPTDGSSVEITVGPFVGNVTISWNVFGGGERDYDQPLWNHYGEPNFAQQIADYAASQGGYGWVLDGPEDPNKFTNFNEVDVEGCLPHPALDSVCVDTYTGHTSFMHPFTGCTGYRYEVDVMEGDLFCANKYTGAIRYAVWGACNSYVEFKVVFQQTSLCASIYTGKLRASPTAVCTAAEHGPYVLS